MTAEIPCGTTIVAFPLWVGRESARARERERERKKERAREREERAGVSVFNLFIRRFSKSDPST